MKISKDVLGLAGLFATSAVVHLAKPSVYQPLMPAWVPRHREVILASGVAELVCAAGLLHPRTRRIAGWSSAALLVAVFPGNVKMANDARRSSSPAVRSAAFARLPLQLPLIRTALKAARSH
ncbi:DoxX family protein [Nocardioides sp.]|uniref:DoxX family protein n=1 Tax=Nocardioides sp. TaxID=35761 RepID=UPI003D148395